VEQVAHYPTHNSHYPTHNSHYPTHNSHYPTHNSYYPTHDTGWRRLIGCLKLQVIFRKRATHHRALLRKRPMMIRHPTTPRHPVQPLCHQKQHCGIFPQRLVYRKAGAGDAHPTLDVLDTRCGGHANRVPQGAIPPVEDAHRLVGSLKLQVSFAEYSLFYRALLRPIILRSLLIVFLQ